jgi:hypothetical protein
MYSFGLNYKDRGLSVSFFAILVLYKTAHESPAIHS